MPRLSPQTSTLTDDSPGQESRRSRQIGVRTDLRVGGAGAAQSGASNPDTELGGSRHHCLQGQNAPAKSGWRDDLEAGDWSSYGEGGDADERTIVGPDGFAQEGVSHSGRQEYGPLRDRRSECRRRELKVNR